MRLGISSYTYGWAVAQGAMDAHALITRARELGVGVVQICDNLPESTWSDVSVETIARQARDAGVAIEVGTRGIAADHLRRFTTIARRLGSPILRIVVDTADDHPTPEQVVRWLKEVPFQNGVYAIENHDRFNAVTLAQIVQQAGVGVCLDTVNSFGALEGPEVVINTLGPHVVNLHLKDFAVTRFEHLQGYTIEGRPAGAGMLDIPRLLEKLYEFRVDPNAIVELWISPEANITDTIRKEVEWAKRSVTTLRQWIKD